jgi:hypothetical protein
LVDSVESMMMHGLANPKRRAFKFGDDIAAVVAPDDGHEDVRNMLSCI